MKRLLIIPFMLVPLAGLAQPAPAPKPSVLIQTQAARQGSVPRMLTAYGSVQPSPNGGSEALSLLRAGRVTRVTAVLGQTVRRGQSLVTVTADPAALAAYRQATSAMTLATGEHTRISQMLSQHLATRDQLAQAEKAVADAPFDGVVSALLAAPGARVAAGAPLVTLARSDRYVAAVGVEPGQRGLLAPNQAVQVQPLDGGSSVPGSVLAVGGMLDPQSRLVPVMVSLTSGGGQPDASGTLLPGGPVRAVVTVGEMRGWLVPRNAVMTDTAGTYLFQVNGTTAARVAVRVVGTSGDTTVVEGPIDASRAVVTSGNTQLQDGGLVRMQQADAGRTAAKP